MSGHRALRLRVIGRGKVGTALARAARAAGASVRLLPGRGALPRGDADLVVLAVPDREVEAAGRRAASAAVRASSMVHTAGILGPEHLAPLRALGWHVGQAHPLASFAGGRGPSLRGITLLVGGDRACVRNASALGRLLGMRPLDGAGVDRVAWHAVAALVANGAAALVALGRERWSQEGLPQRVAERALGALLASVASNVLEVGLPDALSGPVRRGDADTVAKHLEALEGVDPGPDRGALDVLAALVRAQVPLARDLGEATPRDLDAILALAAGRR